MKKWLPWILTAVFAAWILSAMRPKTEKEFHAREFGKLPVLSIHCTLGSFRPADELILAATRFSGVPAFIELMDLDAIEKLRDPFQKQIEELLS